MKVLFLGTPTFALPIFQRLLKSSHSVVAVVTQPDRPRGRGQKVEPSPVKEAARAAGLPVLEPKDPSASDFLRAVRIAAPDCAVVIAYGRLLSRAFLELFPQGVYNLHASLLPKFRGAAPIQWALIRGEKETGVTLFQLDERLDHGPILLRQSTPIPPEEDAVSLAHRLADLGAQTVQAALDQLAAGPVPLQPQEESQATLAPRLTKESGRIDWNETAQEIHNLVRGVQPWPGAFTSLEGGRIKILAARVEKDDQPVGLSLSKPKAGAILSVSTKEGLLVQAGRGILQILRLQPEGGKPLAAADYLRGHPLHPSEHFQ